MSKRSSVYGVGINDYHGATKVNGKALQFYTTWKGAFLRCYCESYLKQYPPYRGCEVCDEWKSLTAYKKWYDKHYVEGWAMDKDLLVKGNKIYSPETCCFLPEEINNFISHRGRKKNGLPIGVYFNKSIGAYIVRIKYKKKDIYLGYSKDPKELAPLYRREKEREARELAEEYKDRLDPRAYDALMNYKEVWDE